MDNEKEKDPGSLLERITGRTLGDIRIHDSAQAGELARRLGARAFTVGRDIYVQPELARPDTPEGAALLAHEITHAVEQSGRAPTEMPLLRPHVPHSGEHVGRGAGSTPVQRQSAQRLFEMRPALPSQTRSEVIAQRVEADVAQPAQGGGESPAEGGGGSPDAEELAERVYRLMLEEARIENERRAYL